MWRCLIDNCIRLLLGLLQQEIQAGPNGQRMETILAPAKSEHKITVTFSDASLLSNLSFCSVMSLKSKAGYNCVGTRFRMDF